MAEVLQNYSCSIYQRKEFCNAAKKEGTHIPPVLLCMLRHPGSHISVLFEWPQIASPFIYYLQQIYYPDSPDQEFAHKAIAYFCFCFQVTPKSWRLLKSYYYRASKRSGGNQKRKGERTRLIFRTLSIQSKTNIGTHLAFLANNSQ